jgi:3,4-dihydroxy-2-butanone 4-phosphate synthase
MNTTLGQLSGCHLFIPIDFNHNLPHTVVLCEIVEDADGSMAPLPKLCLFAERDNLKIIPVADLIK